MLPAAYPTSTEDDIGLGRSIWRNSIRVRNHKHPWLRKSSQAFDLAQRWRINGKGQGGGGELQPPA